MSPSGLQIVVIATTLLEGQRAVKGEGEERRAGVRRCLLCRRPYGLECRYARISEFLGIYIYMYYSDHNPPHVHAIYGQFDAEFAIEDGKRLRGVFPPRAEKLVQEWAAILTRNHCRKTGSGL
ncbi:MAG: DUF4160 domain-containing protein [Spirochaetaceae bacterium]